MAIFSHESGLRRLAGPNLHDTLRKMKNPPVAARPKRPPGGPGSRKRAQDMANPQNIRIFVRRYDCPMKHTVLALLLVMAVSLGEAAAQNIALGERVPR